MPPLTPPSSKRGKTTIGLVNEAITNLKRAMNNSEDEFQVCESYSSAIKVTPSPNALLLQEKIQSLITRERISCMTSPSPLHFHIPQDIIYEYLSPSTSSSDQSNIGNRDVVQETIISINPEDYI
jgi:hypothetical protein